MKRKRFERKLGQTIDKYMREKGYYLHFIKGIVKPKESPIIQKCGPAYSIGTISSLIGFIVIFDELPSIMRDSEEFDFVIAHKICHIVKGHSTIKEIHHILKMIYPVWAPWTVFRRFLDLKPIGASLVKGQELSADSCAVRLTQNKKAAISAIGKLCELSGSDLNTPSHGMIKREFLLRAPELTPTETFGERIKNIRNLQL